MEDEAKALDNEAERYRPHGHAYVEYVAKRAKAGGIRYVLRALDLEHNISPDDALQYQMKAPSDV
jgi:hypothetical protein